jgi:hypothetical protein
VLVTKNAGGEVEVLETGTVQIDKASAQELKAGLENASAGLAG